MLGEQILEEKGKVTGLRVLSTSPPKVEIDFQAEGTILGIGTSNVATYWSEMRPNGTMYGEAKGILTTKDGDVATWNAQGVGKPIGTRGAARWRGAVYYHSSAEKLSKLNEMAVVFEYESDDDGNSIAKGWEWS